MDKENIKEMSAKDLLSLFQKVVVAWHYEPICNRPEYSSYSVLELEEEILRRLMEGNLDNC